MEYIVLFAFPFFINCFRDYRREKIGNFKFYLMGWSLAFICYLINALIDKALHLGLLFVYMVVISVYISFDIICTDYGHVHLFGKRKEKKD